MQIFGGKINEKISATVSNYKLNKEISDLESKKAALQRAVMNEIGALNAGIAQLYADIGRFIYERVTSGEAVELDDVADKFEKITELKQSITDKEAKAQEIMNRHEEELSLLRNLAQPQGVAPSMVGGAVCGACGALYQVGVDVFCGGCGGKLNSAPNAAPVPVGAAAEAHCKTCNAAYQEDVDTFCSGCGGRL